jgi:hypothetical protein
MEEYKGLYYNDNTEQQFYEGGAHFRYKDLYQILEELVKKANSKKIPKTIKHVSSLILIII